MIVVQASLWLLLRRYTSIANTRVNATISNKNASSFERFGFSANGAWNDYR